VNRVPRELSGLVGMRILRTNERELVAPDGDASFGVGLDLHGVGSLGSDFASDYAMGKSRANAKPK